MIDFKSILEKVSVVADAVKITKAFVQFNPSPVVMLDSKHNILIWTKAFIEEFCLEDIDLSGMNLFDLLPCCYKHNATFAKAIEEEIQLTGILGCDSTCVVPLICKNVIRRFSINPWPSNGHTGGVIIYFKNITKEKEFETILDILPGWIFYKDLNNNNVWINQELADDMGWESRDVMIGKNWSDMVVNGEKYLKDDLRVIESKQKLVIEETSDIVGQGKWLVKTTKVPWFDNFGNVKGVIGYSTKLKKER